MGLLAVGIGSAKDVLADSWRDYFYCDSMDETVLACRALKKTDRGNKKGSNNIISDGSIIAVNEGQCMVIVDQGQVVELCAEAGQFTYDKSSEPSLFYGKLSANIGKTFEQFFKRVSFGGNTGTDQRVYFFNTKEIMGNKYGTANPIPFRVVDKNTGLDLDTKLKAHGEYSFRIEDPLLFYKNVCGNFEGSYTRDEIESQLKSELLTAMQPALAQISEMGIRYSALPGHTMEIANALNDVLSKDWRDKRGIVIVNFGISSVTIPEEDENRIKKLQETAVFTNAAMGAANMNAATADAMRDAAKNTATGPMFAFANMNAAAQMGQAQQNSLYQMAAQQAQAQPQMAPSSQAGAWTCACGATNTGKFCSNCGQPAPSANWTCSCGAVNSGKFCSNCGQPRP